MAEIRPFRGLRYSSEAGDLNTLVAPPYDVLDAQEREAYAAKNPYNIVHLTLPEAKGDDRSKFIKYARSAAALSEWRREGIVAPEPKPALYRYTQSYEIEGKLLTRTSLIVLIRVEPFETGTVLPHEQTFPKHKEDRLRILEATRSHLESIFGLFEDPGGAIHKAISEAPASVSVNCVGDDGTTHQLEPIDDTAAIEAFEKSFAEKRIWIADGHHRYETALAFRQALGERDHVVPEDYMIISLSSMSDPGLVLLPTHRVVPRLKDATPEELESQLSEVFHVERRNSAELIDEINAAYKKGHHAFGIALKDHQGLLLRAKDDAAIAGRVPGEGSEQLKALDVSILHSVIFEQLLKLPATETIQYTRDNAEALQISSEGKGAAFLMEPPTVEDMRKIALGGERMPQKSTFYFPKVLSGLVIWSLIDF